MWSLFRNPDYARLFAAQVVALGGTGLMSVALGLLAYDLAGDAAGAVLAIVYTIKMVAYVGLSPIAQALAARLPRKTVLICADLLRAAAALALPFVSEVWHVYGLVFVLQAASATFTPAYQAVLPDLLPDERDYTRALSLSRLAYDLENLSSPVLAALLLLVIPFSALFAGTALGFIVSAALVWRSHVPRTPGTRRSFRERLTRGIGLYLATPRLRGLLAVNFCAAAASAFVLVNTVVLVRSGYGAGEAALALAMACYGAGSMAVALVLPRVLDHWPDRPVMLTGGFGLAGIGLFAGGVIWVSGLPSVPLGLLAMAMTGALYAATLTPAGRLIKRSSASEDRPALFAAHFAASHACWLITYPLAGFAATHWGAGPALLILSALGLVTTLVATRLWPRHMDKSAPA